MQGSIINNKTNKLILQILLLGGIWLLVPLIFNDFDIDRFNFRRGSKILLGIIFIILVNNLWLLPKFYFQGKVLVYFVLGVLLIVATHFCIEMLVDPAFDLLGEARPRRGRRGGGRSNNFNIPREFNRLMPYLLAFVGSALYEISSFVNRKTKEAMLLKSEKLETEMKLLKSQINPHFLFNALNNIYSLSYLKPEKTPENLLKLSEMLRYMLYECNEDKVPLEKELTYLENYIALKLLKDSRGMKVSVNLERNHKEQLIAPMLLIPFIENAFKHGNIEDLENGWIQIDLKLVSKKIIFDVNNSYASTTSTKDEVGGIGLVNVNRQLDLIYPNTHQLEIANKAGVYSVHLEIDL